jgi:hypothetical protein
MTNGRVMGVSGLGLMLCLAIAGNAQEPTSKARPKVPPLDAKALADPKRDEATAALLESAYQGQTMPESVRMLITILRSVPLAAGEGWFGPAQKRYTWEWLASRYGVDPLNGSISRKQFRGSDAWFARLDRDKNGVITYSDLDWSEGKQEQAANPIDLLKGNDASCAVKPADMPSRPVLIRSFFAGEIGSMNEGPKLNDQAPRFTLKTVDGKASVELDKLIGAKPLVLVFGSFTCGRFRSQYAAVEELKQRYGGQLEFLAVYVREAHPTDGWRMQSNDDSGISLKQPCNEGERVTVAQRCCGKLKMSMPMVVDAMDDRVGHAYSGMLNRLYLIDRKGRIAYKSGRGPFGFKPDELEKSLLILLLDRQGTVGAPNPDKR